MLICHTDVLYVIIILIISDILAAFPLPKVHVNLLLMEARMQAELLYALRAITQYMT